MRAAYDVAALRAAEESARAGLRPGTLMQRAAAATARRAAVMLGRVYGSRVLLLVGRGDNGGDALFAGTRLAGRGASVEALLAADQAHEQGLAEFAAAGGRVHQPAAAAGVLGRRFDLVVDGLTGIGGRGGLRPPADAWADSLPGCPVLAVDLPSGVDADSGRVDGAAIRADVTVTFGALKPGLLVDPGAGHAGLVECVDIGMAPDAVPALRVAEAADIADWLPVARAESDKYRRGVVGVLAGSTDYPGAAALCVGAAIRAGAGMVRYAGPEAAVDLVRARWPEAVCTVLGESDDDPTTAGQVQAWVAGPGLGTDDGARARLDRLLESTAPLLLDADALNALAGSPERIARRDHPTLLTPHAGEFARLLGTERDQVEADRLSWANRAAAHLGAVVLLKGSTTVVAAPGETWVNPTGTPLLATAGSGDVLSGGCGALLARGLDPLRAGVAGAYLHGLAARLAADRTSGAAPGGEPAAVRALDVVSHWPSAVAAVLG